MSCDPRAGFAYCRRAARASGSNFYYALWLLPPARRQAMFAVYSFCRAVDDVVDDGRSTEDAQEELARWRQELAACYEAFPVHPIAQALQEVARSYDIPRQLFEDILTGMGWDLAPRRYATFHELEQYCHYVAGAVGLVAIKVFGCRRPESQVFARALGTAFQLTNILRDVAGDAARGRLYLPQEDLERFRVSESQMRQLRGLSLPGPRLPDGQGQAGPQGTVPESVRALLAFEGKRAWEFFAQARAAVTRDDRLALTPALAMAAVYERLLHRLAAVDYDVFSHPVRLSTPQKVLMALRGALT